MSRLEVSAVALYQEQKAPDVCELEEELLYFTFQTRQKKCDTVTVQFVS